MNTIPKEWLDFLRQQFPEGWRVRLRPSPIKPGSVGTLKYIDDAGTFHVRWNDGRELGLVLGRDSFSIFPPPVQTLKLYMPITATYYDCDEDNLEVELTMDSIEAPGYAPQIIAAMREEQSWLDREAESPEEAERGLMAYYDSDDGVARNQGFYSVCIIATIYFALRPPVLLPRSFHQNALGIYPHALR